jgi:hypothetical protein
VARIRKAVMKKYVNNKSVISIQFNSIQFNQFNSTQCTLAIGAVVTLFVIVVVEVIVIDVVIVIDDVFVALGFASIVLVIFVVVAHHCSYNKIETLIQSLLRLCTMFAIPIKIKFFAQCYGLFRRHNLVHITVE